MRLLKITKEFGWDCAHFLNDKNMSVEDNKRAFGPCNSVHGHTYKLFVTVSSCKFPEGSDNMLNGMVVNFVHLKRVVRDLIVKRFDHTLLNDDSLYQDRLTTCENQVGDIWDILEPTFSQMGIEIESIKLYETPTSFAELVR